MKMSFKKIILSLLVVCGVGSAVWFAIHKKQAPSASLSSKYDIRLLDVARDTEFIKRQNYENWYLLHATPEFNLDFMLTKNSPYEWEPRTYGKLTTVVIFDENKPVGFINYYMRGAHEGTVFLLSVDKNARGKGFGEVLFGYAVESLKKQGAKYIKVSVREENEPAQKLYRKFGMYIETSDHGFHFYRLDV